MSGNPKRNVAVKKLGALKEKAREASQPKNSGSKLTADIIVVKPLNAD